MKVVLKALGVLLGTALALGLAAESNSGCESQGSKQDQKMDPVCTDGNGWIIDCEER